MDTTQETQQSIHDILTEVYLSGKANPRQYMGNLEAGILEDIAETYAYGSLTDHLVENMGYFPIPDEDGGEGDEHFASAHDQLYDEFVSTYVSKYVLEQKTRKERYQTLLEHWGDSNGEPPTPPTPPPFLEWLHKDIALNYIKARNKAEIATAILTGRLGAISQAQAARNLEVAGTTIPGWVERGTKKIERAQSIKAQVEGE